VLFSRDDFAQTKTIVGIILTLLTAFMWAIYTISVKVAFKRHDPRNSFFVITAYTLAGLAVLEFLFGDFSQSFQMGWEQWGYLIISGIVAIALSHVFYYTAIKRIGATIPALVLLATPFFVLITSNIVFGEVLTPAQMIFGLVLLGGSATAILAQGRLKKIQP
jgi:drug/metabolite transporter (DMT)-like permease